MTALSHIPPHRAAELMQRGAILIDIREADEHARERIPGARHHALSRLDAEGPARSGGPVTIFHCRSGARTRANASRLAAAAAPSEVHVLEGGIDAWKRAGLPTAVDRNQPIELNRQVQIVVGSLVLAGVLLGATVWPGFYILSGFVGAGLLFAGISGFCGMAIVLAKMPWNNRKGSGTTAAV